MTAKQQPMHQRPAETIDAPTAVRRQPRQRKAETVDAPPVMPVIVMDETVLLPHMSLPLPIEDDETAAAIDAAARYGRLVLLLTERLIAPRGAAEPAGSVEGAAPAARPAQAAQAVAASEYLGEDDGEDEYELCEVGVIAEVGQQITRPGSPTHVILQGLARGRVLDFGSGRGYPLATVARHDDPPERTREAEAAMTTVLGQVETYLS